MKHKLYILLTILAFGCNDDFLNRYPTAAINEENFWNNENELQQYINSLYQNTNHFEGHGNAHTHSPMITGDNQSDNQVPVDYNEVAAGEHVVPATGGGWTWNHVRTCNYFLNRYDQTPITQSIKDGYAGEVRVFRALEYFRLVKRFGDVPWISEDLATNSEKLFAPQDSRIVVMDHVLEDLDWAIEHLPNADESVQGRINRDVALILKARICLHEGTFRKYHDIEGSGAFLEEALEASQILMNEGNYELYNTGNPETDYATVFNSLDLSGNPEIIMYRRYEEDLLGNRTVQFVHDNAFNTGGSKSLIDAYLCNDGMPPVLSDLYLGDDRIEDEMLNRDPRLLQTFVYPRTTIQEGFPGPAIPGTDFASSSLNAGICPTGYQILKYWVDDEEEYLRIQNGILDAPTLRYGEVLLIHAEAAAELGRCTQETLDNSINLLRQRAGMPAMILGEIEGWSAVQDYSLDYPHISDPLINEIRRERRIELAVEGFRYDDLMRWRAGELLTQRLTGMKFDQSVYPDVEIGKDIFLTNDGFIWPYAKSLPNGRGFDENKHYYFPIPTEELTLNENLKQNPGW